MSKYFLRTLTFIALLLFGFKASADVIIDANTSRVLIGKDVYVLQPDKELGLGDVLKSAGFKKYNKDVPNLGFSANSTWLRFTINNKSANTGMLLDVAYPILDEVELFSADNKGVYHGNLMGEIKPFHTRKYDHPDYIFDLNIPQNTSKTYYLRVKSAEQLILPISINEPATLWQVLSREDVLSGLFIGAIVIMFLYNLFIYFSVRDKSYFYYVIYVASVGLTQIGIKGFTFQYLWGNATGFELKSVVLFACIGPIAALLFTKIFLTTSERARRFDKVLTAIIVLMIVAFLVTLTGQIQTGFKLMQIFTTLFAFSLIIVSVIVMINGYRPAKFVFLSWLSLLIGAVIFALKDNGVLPYNTFTSYSMQGATVIEMALLSFGLADRINILKKEKEASQAEALNVAKENERIIREQNVVLELKVSERTHELNQSLDDLKQAQSQLVDSEKMASLGQLTAGIAHEINNPINFVTSNINPLKRDVEMILDVMNTIENVSQSDAPVEEKKKQIEEYKEEVDFDYLVMEIRHLIKGIYEGASRTAEIVKGLKIFSRLDEDDLKRTDINEGLESTLIIANNLVGSKTKIIRDYGELPLVECYAGKLNQVFLNIISNAAYAIDKKFGDNDGGEIKVSTTIDKGNVEIAIADNGIGMNEQTVKKIFEPFFTTKDVGEGTGLGMSIAYNTIKKHNGQIVVNSEVGKGTEFILKIPAVYDTKAA
ncbi:sensor histidine kinase [Mucilaginibacter panaciglaebae]|uniref:histidine kinase n=1 Tax=Mucilaginibacter panaciglaebae TaxID=502331 RepID=A0ABP7WR40_9SPHI